MASSRLVLPEPLRPVITVVPVGSGAMAASAMFRKSERFSEATYTGRPPGTCPSMAYDTRTGINR